MNFDKYLLNIANRSVFLSEKIETLDLKTEVKIKDDNNHITQWKEKLTDENLENFSDRISLIDLREDELGSFLSYELYTSKEDCPKWVFSFEKLLKLYNKEYSDKTKEDYYNNDPIPFEDIITPIVNYIKRKCISSNKIISDTAIQKVGHFVLESLSELLSQCLYTELYNFSELTSSSKLNYIDFTKRFLTPDNANFRLSFFQEYSVLARLLTSEVNNWITFLNFFLASIKNDYEDLEKFINQGKLGKVTDIEIGISDKHDGGKSVVKVIFANKGIIFFKPRSSGVEKDLFDFASFLNGLSTSLNFQMRVPRILSKSDHSWVEYIPFNDINKHNSLETYYKRCGNILYVAHLLSGTDFHYENVICDGEFPVLIDTETLLQPNTRKFKNEKKSVEGDLVFNGSVLMTLLLPQWQEIDDINSYDIGGFSADGGNTGIFKLNWTNINTPRMGVNFKETFIESRTHKPLGAPNKYKKEIIAGFTNAHKLITTHRDHVLKVLSEKKWFKGQQTRVVVRPTKIYAKLISKLRHPKFMRSGVAYGIELEQLLLNAFEKDLTIEEKTDWLKFYKTECDVLQEMNIPIYHVETNRLDLTENNKIVFPRCFLRSGYNLFLDNIKKRNDNYLEEQIHIIHGSMLSRYTNRLFKFEISSVKNNLVSQLDFTKIASEIGDVLLLSAFKKDEKIIGFSSLRRNAMTQKYNIQMINNSFMSGQLGIAYYFAALFNATKEIKYLNAVRDCLKNILQEIEDENSLKNLHFGYDGIAGYIYGLSKIAFYINDQSLYHISQKLIEYTKGLTSSYMDVTFGVAGLISSIIVWSKFTSDKSYSEYLRTLGNQIINRDYTNWGIELQEEPITGFSHGISGVANTLISLDNFLDSKEFSTTAISALKYESSLFDSTIGGWKDSREFIIEKDRVILDWSHGAVGIGLARIGLQGEDVFSEDFRKIERSFKQKESYFYEYNLANGILGVIDFRMQYTTFSQLIEDCLCQFRDQGMMNSKFQPNKKLSQQPSLFYGLSGLGYQLLRASDPILFPSLLFN